MKVVVFVNSIHKDNMNRIIVEASNGSKEGPPFVRFQLPNLNPKEECYVGKKYNLIIVEEI